MIKFIWASQFLFYLCKFNFRQNIFQDNIFLGSDWHTMILKVNTNIYTGGKFLELHIFIISQIISNQKLTIGQN